MTRSNPQGELFDHHIDINALERELRRARERQRHIERLNMEAPNNGAVFGPHPRPRAIGDFDEPNQREVSLGIVPPPLEEGHIELKPSTLHMIERSTFKGNAIECPLEHLDRFERICKTIYMRNVPEESKKMILFPFSLEDKGSYWERTIPTSKVSTWEEVKKEFLLKFYPKQKTARFRNDIQTFAQLGGESMSEAWDRLRGLTRSCPHHGMSKENLLGLFYRGVHNDIRRALDTASNGSFSSLDVERAETLIENLAQSDACFGGDYERNSRKVVANVEEAKDSAELQRELSRELGDKLCEKFEKLGKMFVTNQKQAFQVEQSQAQHQDPSQGFYQEGYQEGSPSGYQEGFNNQEWSGNEQSQEVAYMSNQGGYNNFRPLHPHPNLSYRSPNVENPSNQTNPPQPPQAFQPRPSNSFPNQNPRPNTNSFNPRPQQPYFYPQGFNARPQSGNFQGYNQPRANFPSQQWNPQQNQGSYAFEDATSRELEKVKEINRILRENVKIANERCIPPEPTRPGTFPAKPETNPKPSCSTLTYGSPYGYLGVDYGYEFNPSGEFDVEGDMGMVDPRNDEVEPVVAVAKEKESSPGCVEKLNVEFESKRIVNDFVSALSSPLMGEAIKGHFLLSKLVNDMEPSRDVVEEVVQPIFKDENPKELTNKEKDALFKARKSLKDLGIHVENGKDLKQVRAQLEFVKSILANKEKVEALVDTYDSTVPTRKVLKKYHAKSMFTIPCSLGDHEVSDAFCDSGSAVSVISAKMASDFGLEGMQPCIGSLTFGDQSVKKPRGVFKDFPIRMGDTIVPTDLLVLDMVGEKRQALLLGIPFMLTAGAKLDYVNRVVSFEHVDKDVFYPLERNSNFELTFADGAPLFTVNEANDDMISVIEDTKEDVVFPIAETNVITYDFGEGEAALERSTKEDPNPPISKRTKRRKRAKSKKTVASMEEIKETPILPVAIPLVFTPTGLEDGKLVCAVRQRHGNKPFASVRVILDSVDKDGNGGAITEKMIKLFGMNLGDPGPSSRRGPPPFAH